MKSSYTFIVVCLIASALATTDVPLDDDLVKLEAVYEECIKQANVTEAETSSMAKDNNATQNMKCFATCFLEKLGILREGVVVEAVALEVFVNVYGEETAKEALEKCKNIKDEDYCDTGYQIFECFESFRQ